MMARLTSSRPDTEAGVSELGCAIVDEPVATDRSDPRCADSLPIDNNLPMTVVRDDSIYLIGGETGGGVVDGQYYGHHPDLLLIGTIEAINNPQ